MSDVLIKSIRLDLRRSAGKYNNIKLSIYKSGIFGKKRILKVDIGEIEDDLGNKLQPMEYSTDDGNDDNLIIDYLHKFLALTKSVDNHNDFNKDAFKSHTELDKSLTQYIPRCKYEIVEDNYTDGYESKSRAFGYDYYHLNNGVSVSISWTKDVYSIGGKKYSDNWGYEVDSSEYTSFSESKWDLKKSVLIWFDAKSYGLKPDYQKDVPAITLDKNNEFIYANDETPENRNSWLSSEMPRERTLDSYILSTIVDKWNELYTNKELVLLSLNSNRPTIDVKFIDPVNRSVPVEQVDPLNPPGLSASIPTTSATASSKIPLVVNDIPEGFTIQAKTDMPLFSIYVGDQTKKVYDDYNDLPELDSEYIEEETTALPEEPVTLDVIDFDPYIGDGTDDTGLVSDKIDQPASGSVNDKQKAFIKNALTNALPNGNSICARYTYNHARNYKAQINGSPISKKIVPSGGNANKNGYFKELIKLGYKQYDKGKVTKDVLISSLKSSFDIGDVVVYWGDGSDSLGGCKYGHTQIYTGGYNNSSREKGLYLWASDGITNYKSSFVYGGAKYSSINIWNYIIFKAPQPKPGNNIA